MSLYEERISGRSRPGGNGDIVDNKHKTRILRRIPDVAICEC